MGKPSAPAAPDPATTAAAQTQSNIATANNNAALNRVDQYSPYGSSTYSITGSNSDGTPTYRQDISLSPGQQNLYDMTLQGEQTLGNTALGQLGNLQNAYSQPFSFGGPNVQSSIPNSGAVQSSVNTSGLPAMQSNVSNSGPSITGQVGTGDYSSQIKQAQDAAYGAQTQYLDPQFQQGQQSLDAKLANQGLSTGSTAYDNAQRNYSLQKQSAYQGAQDAAVAAGNQEQNTLYGQALSSAGFQNSANQQGYNQGLSNANLANSVNQQGFAQGLSSADLANQAQNQQFGQNLSGANLNNSASAQGLQQQLALYNQPLNSYNALATGAQVTNPSFGSVPTANQANTDVAGINNSAYQNQLSQYQNSMSGINNLFSLGGSLGSAAILSDRRVKREVTRIGTTPGGIPTYTFKYNGDDDEIYFGVMADEVAHIDGAVIHGLDGFDRVDYSRVK